MQRKNEKKIYILAQKLSFDFTIFFPAVLLFVWLLFWNCPCVLADEIPDFDGVNVVDSEVVSQDPLQVTNLYVQNLIQQPIEIEEEEEIEIMSLAAPVASGESIPDSNVIKFQGSFNSTSYYLVFPASYIDSLYVTDNGYLLNVSAAALTGRLFSSETFSLSDTNYILFTLNPILTSNSIQSLYQYGSTSFASYYSIASGRVQHNDVYGLFTVQRQIVTDLQDYDYLSFVVLILILFSVFALLIRRVLLVGEQ